MGESADAVPVPEVEPEDPIDLPTVNNTQVNICLLIIVLASLEIGNNPSDHNVVFSMNTPRF